jgi:hypothetical protein
MIQWYRSMRGAALVLVLLAGAGCRRGSLEQDASGGTGTIGRDGGGAIEGEAGAPAGIDAALPTPDANCGSVTFVSKFLAPKILLLIDQSWSDYEQGAAMIMAVNTMIASNGPKIDWGVYTFPKRGPACSAETVASTVDLAVTPENYIAASAQTGAVWLGGSGTPTAAAIRAGTDYLRALPTDTPRYLMLVTHGAPSCAGSIGALSDDAPQALTDALAAIRDAAGENLTTMVVAPEKIADADLAALNALADAGGHANTGQSIRYIPGPVLSAYQLTGSTTCTFALANAPPVPERVAVTIDGAAVPRDPTRVDGWDYTDALHTSFTFNGSSCERLWRSRQFEVNVFYGCP